MSQTETPDSPSAPTWRRLSPRMLLVHPVQQVLQYLPALLGVVVLGRANDNTPWWFEPVFVVIPVLLGISRWFTTTYTITDDTIRLRTGLFARKTLTANLDRVRTVDAVAPPLHRVLGLAKVMIGTGADKPFELNGLGAPQARSLRAELLHRGSLQPGSTVAGGTGDTERGDAVPTAGAPTTTPTAGETVLGSFRPGWVLLAPFTLSGLLGVLAVWGFLGQFSEQIIRRLSDSEGSGRVIGFLQGLGFWLAAVLVGVVVVAVLAALSMVSYVLAYWGYRLTRHPGGTLHVSRGLLTTRATSLDEARIRGARLVEPYFMRLVSAAKAVALTTGFDRAADAANAANSLLTPPAPQPVVTAITAAVLRSGEPVAAPLIPHGPAARRRRYIRALAVAVVAVGLVLGGRVWLGWPVWLLAVPVLLLLGAPVLAEQRYRSLGHTVAQGHLVARAGLFPRDRAMLQADGVIGWTLTQTFFQRRAGLVTLQATTAAGLGVVSVVDVPYALALTLVGTVSPRLLGQFVVAAR